jgi:DNA-binding response OmpR family regulator
MLTARDKSTDRVKGYEEGADIYLTKPASHEELLGALNSLTRRMGQNQESEAGWTLHTNTLQLLGGAHSAELTHNEVLLLRALAIAPQRTLAYWQICEALGLDVSMADKAALEVRVVRLRKKLLAVGIAAPAIRSVHKHGYELLAPIQVLD